MSWAYRNKKRIAKHKLEPKTLDYQGILKLHSGNPYRDALGRFASAENAKLKIDEALNASTKEEHQVAAEGHKRVAEKVAPLNEKVYRAHLAAARYHENAKRVHEANSENKGVASAAAREMSKRAFDEHKRVREKWDEMHKHMQKVHLGDPLFGF